MLTIQEKLSLAFIPGNLEQYKKDQEDKVARLREENPTDLFPAIDLNIELATLCRNVFYAEILLIGAGVWYAKNKEWGTTTAAKVAGVCALILVGATGMVLNAAFDNLGFRIRSFHEKLEQIDNSDIKAFCFALNLPHLPGAADTLQANHPFISAARELGVPERFLRHDITVEEAQEQGLIRELKERHLNVDRILERVTCKQFIDKVLTDETYIAAARALGVQERFLASDLTVQEAESRGLVTHLKDLDVDLGHIFGYDPTTVERFIDEILPYPERMAATRELLHRRFMPPSLYTAQNLRTSFGSDLCKRLKSRGVTIDRIINQANGLD